MTLISSDLREFLLSEPAIERLIEERLYPLVLPQNAPLPSLTYSEVSNVRTRDYQGSTRRARMRVTVSAWASTQIEAHALIDQVRRKLDRFKGLMGATLVGSVSVSDEIELYEDEAGPGNQRGVYRVAQDYIISHTED